MEKHFVIVTVVIVSGFIFSACSPNISSAPPSTPATSNDAQVTEAAVTAKNSYVKYSDELFESLKGKQKFVLFFHASWCPTCRKLDKNINANLDKLPENAILKIDYDTATELKKEYGIRVQHTLVFYDVNGKVVKTDIGTRFDKIDQFFNR